MRHSGDSRDHGSEFRVEIQSEKGRPSYAGIVGDTLDTHIYLTGDHEKDVEDIIKTIAEYVQ